MGRGSMRAPKERFDFVHQFLKRVFIDDLHSKRVLSLANGALGVMTGATLAVSLIGQALAQARGLFAKSAIKQVDRLLSNAGVVPWDVFAPWVREVVGERREIVVAMDWTSTPTTSPRSRCTSSPATEGPCPSSGSPSTRTN